MTATQYYVSTDWTGGIFISPTMAGSRSGGIIAATWAALVNNGMDGYRKATKDIVETLGFLVKGYVVSVDLKVEKTYRFFIFHRISEIPGLRILGDPRFCIVAFAATDTSGFHIFSLADEMKAKGWLISCLQYPTWCDRVKL